MTDRAARLKLAADTTFAEHLEIFVNGCQQIITDGWGEGHVLPIPQLSTTEGKRYVKLIKTNHPGQGGSVHCFVDKTNGDVLKPAGWNKPAKHARGNIFDQDNGLGWMGEYGPAYLQSGRRGKK